MLCLFPIGINNCDGHVPPPVALGELYEGSGDKTITHAYARMAQAQLAIPCILCAAVRTTK